MAILAIFTTLGLFSRNKFTVASSSGESSDTEGSGALSFWVGGGEASLLRLLFKNTGRTGTPAPTGTPPAPTGTPALVLPALTLAVLLPATKYVVCREGGVGMEGMVFWDCATEGGGVVGVAVAGVAGVGTQGVRPARLRRMVAAARAPARRRPRMLACTAFCGETRGGAVGYTKGGVIAGIQRGSDWGYTKGGVIGGIQRGSDWAGAAHKCVHHA